MFQKFFNPTPDDVIDATWRELPPANTLDSDETVISSDEIARTTDIIANESIVLPSGMVVMRDGTAGPDTYSPGSRIFEDPNDTDEDVLAFEDWAAQPILPLTYLAQATEFKNEALQPLTRIAHGIYPSSAGRSSRRSGIFGQLLSSWRKE